MALIRVTHLECGDVKLTSKDVKLYTYEGNAECPSG